jgi:hypothetical protein
LVFSCSLDISRLWPRQREKQIIAEEKLRIEEMNRQAQQTLEHAEMIRQKVTEAQELNALAAEKVSRSTCFFFLLPFSFSVG